MESEIVLKNILCNVLSLTKCWPTCIGNMNALRGKIIY